jgi:C4-dicarboxylate-specific signal transduction histidine kinase
MRPETTATERFEDRELALTLCLDMSQPIACLLSNLAQLDRLLVREDGPDAGRAHEWLKSAFAAADQMARVLDEGRARTLRGPARTQRIELRSLLRNTLAMSAGEAAGRARVELEAPQPVWMMGSPVQLVQAFSALLVHFAVRHSDGPRRVTLRLASDEGWALVELARSRADGLDGDVIVTPKPDAASLALGLLRARRIVAGHGGRVELEEGSDRGVVRLPMVRE